MIDNFITVIGGYNSWQFAALAYGSLAIGLGLYFFRWYLFPLVAFGIIMIYSYLNTEATKAVASSGNAWVSIVPIFFPIMMIVLLVGTKSGVFTTKSKDEE